MLGTNGGQSPGGNREVPRTLLFHRIEYWNLALVVGTSSWTIAPQLTSRADNVMRVKQGAHPRHLGCGDTLKSGFQNGYQIRRVLDGACQSVHTLSRPKEP